MTDRNWRQLAACLSVDPELFFPDKGDRASRHQALSICSTCPVVDACRDAAANEAHGIWGGQTENVRNAATGIRASTRPLEDWQRELDVKPCGTAAAYRRHQRAGETPCMPCIEAHTRYTRERVRNR